MTKYKPGKGPPDMEMLEKMRRRRQTSQTRTPQVTVTGPTEPAWRTLRIVAAGGEARLVREMFEGCSLQTDQCSNESDDGADRPS